MEESFAARRAEAQRFLEALFTGVDPQATLSLFVLPGAYSLSFPVSSLEEAAHEAVQASLERVNVYVSCCALRSQRGAGRGVAADAVAIPGVWADLDIASVAHKGESLVPDWGAALKLLDALGLPPTLVVDSGWGIHAWWLLDEPRALTSDEGRASAHQLVRGGQQALRTLAEEQGWTIDPTDDLARVLRVPGTINWKVEGSPAPVSLVVEDGPRYSLGDLWRRWAHLVPAVGKTVTPLPDRITTGGRTHSVASLAGTLRRRNAAETVALAAALEHNRTVCDPPLVETKVAETVRGIYKRYEPVEEPPRNGHRSPPKAPPGTVLRGSEVFSLEVPEIRTLPLLDRPGMILEGGSNLLYAYPKSGKTELIRHALEEWLRGGRKVVYLTEEPLWMWTTRLRYYSHQAEFWGDILFCAAHGWGIEQVLAFLPGDIDVLVVDTLRSTCGYQEGKGDEDVVKVIMPLITAARDRDSTLLALYHARKMPGEAGRDISGHHSLYGAFDRAIQLRTVDGEGNERQRRLSVSGRMLAPDSPTGLSYAMRSDGMFVALDGRSVVGWDKECEQCHAAFTAKRSDARFCSDVCRVVASRRSGGDGE